MVGLATALVNSISSAIHPNAQELRVGEAILIPIADSGAVDTTGIPIRRFQYFPETIQDTKAVNYQQKEVPGASLPIYQWVSSGERLVSFTAQFSCDVDLTANEQIAGLVDQRSGIQDRNVDVRSAIAWLRSFLLPRYGQANGEGDGSASGGGSGGGSAGGKGGGGAGGGSAPSYLTYPPKRVQLFLPNSGIGVAGGNVAVTSGGSMFPDSIRCVMTQCDVTWEAYFPSGIPRLASVSLAFAQIGQFGGNVKFPSSDALKDAVVPPQSGAPFFGYRLAPRSNNQSTADQGG